jgi:ferritin-like metal-binding protein YciE
VAEQLTNPRELFAARLREMLWIELKLAEDVLPQLLDQSHSTDLQYAFERHLLETREHVEVVRGMLAGLEVPIDPEESPALKGLVSEHEELVKRIESSRHDLLDLAHAQAAAATEHIEMAAYDALAGMAEALGEEELATTLRELMEQEQFALEQVKRALTTLLAEKVESERLERES